MQKFDAFARDSLFACYVIFYRRHDRQEGCSPCPLLLFALVSFHVVEDPEILKIPVFPTFRNYSSIWRRSAPQLGLFGLFSGNATVSYTPK